VSAIDYGHPKRCPICNRPPVKQSGTGPSAKHRFICQSCNVAGLWKSRPYQALLAWNEPGGIVPVRF
jgi:hypothetical protein